MSKPRQRRSAIQCRQELTRQLFCRETEHIHATQQQLTRSPENHVHRFHLDTRCRRRNPTHNAEAPRGVSLDNRGGLSIGRQVSIAHDARIYTLGHDIHHPDFPAKAKPVRIDDHAVIFAAAMIMPGVHLGEGAVVMAGAVVTKDVPPLRVVGGNPARDLGPRRCVPSYRLGRRYWFAH